MGTGLIGNPAVLSIVTLSLSLSAPGLRAEEQRRARLDAWGDPLPPGALFRTGTTRAHHDLLGLLQLSVGALRYSPDNRLLAALADDFTVRLWNAGTGKDLHTLAQPKRIWCFAFSPDGKAIVSGGDDGMVRRWEIDSGREIAHFTAHQHAVQSLVLARGGTWGASTNGREICLWDLATGKQFRRIPLAEGSVLHTCHLALSPDGKELMCACIFSRSIRIWETATGKELMQFRGTDSATGQALFLADGKRVLTHTGRVTIWELATGRVLHRFERAGSALAVSPDGTVAATAGALVGGNHLVRSNVIHLWDLSTGKELATLRGHEDEVDWLAFSPDGKMLASFGRDQTLRRWDLKTGRELGPRVGHQHAVTSLAFSPDGKFLASGSCDGTARLWDRKTGSEIRCFRSENERVKAVAFLKGSAILICQNEALPPEGMQEPGEYPLTRLRLWDVATGREVRHFDLSGFSTYAAAVCSEKQLVALAGGEIRPLDTSGGKPGEPRDPDKYTADGQIRLLDVRSGKEIRRWQGGGTSLAFSSDGKLLATASGQIGLHQSGELTVWSTDSGKERSRATCSYPLSYVAFTPDGSSVAAGTHWMGLWDVATGKSLGLATPKTIAGLPRWNSCMVLSPDGKSLVTGDGANSAILWEVATRQIRRTFSAHAVTCLAFSPDGRLLATGGNDTLVMAWDLTARVRPGATGKKGVEALWEDLGGNDAEAAYDVIWELASLPQQTLEYVRTRLPVHSPTDLRHLEQLIADLDADRFAVREQARKELEALGWQAERELRRSLAAKPPLEVRKRLEDLLGLLRKPPDPATDAGLRQAIRLIEVLERIGTPAAREALKEMADRGRLSHIRREATASLERLAKPRPAAEER